MAGPYWVCTRACWQKIKSIPLKPVRKNICRLFQVQNRSPRDRYICIDTLGDDLSINSRRSEIKKRICPMIPKIPYILLDLDSCIKKNKLTSLVSVGFNHDKVGSGCCSAVF